MNSTSKIAVRLEGGLGDHILGMRLLPFVHKRYAHHAICLFSDSGGAEAQMQVACMSPYASEVHAVLQKPGAARYETMGRLENLREEDLDRMRSADAFFDAWGGTYYLEASRALNISYTDVFAARPELHVPLDARHSADVLLAPYAGKHLVGVQLAKFGASFWQHADKPCAMIHRLLEDERVVVLNMFQTEFEYPHWPGETMQIRHELALQDCEALERLCDEHPRIIRMADLSLPVLAAVLERCRYFIGVDNGIKHLAWALGIPLTMFSPFTPSLEFIIRWIPDLHRLLLCGCPEDELSRHVDEARAALSNGEPL